MWLWFLSRTTWMIYSVDLLDPIKNRNKNHAVIVFYQEQLGWFIAWISPTLLTIGIRITLWMWFLSRTTWMIYSVDLLDPIKKRITYANCIADVSGFLLCWLVVALLLQILHTFVSIPPYAHKVNDLEVGILGDEIFLEKTNKQTAQLYVILFFFFRTPLFFFSFFLFFFFFLYFSACHTAMTTNVFHVFKELCISFYLERFTICLMNN